ncbi:MAG TPA: thiamine pyrophosphate-binding protein [Mycobacteriales bacterium]|nr:thiamine pyrophosphate-binding protein [Mycobacteriales bacterium]
MNGGQALVGALEALDVQVVFGLPGVHNLAAWEALAHSRIRLVGVRHEQAAAYAADGYARSTGRLGVAIATTGPGAANMLGAVGEAWASRSPVLAIATDIPAALRRDGVYRGVLHETTDQASMFAAVTKKTLTVSNAEQIGLLTLAAGETALAAAQRPVYLQIPTDLLSQQVAEPPLREGVLRRLDEPLADNDMAGAAELLAGAQRPLIWVGGGAVAAGAATLVGELAERLAAPVITTYQARGLLGADHPMAVGLPPHLPECGALWDEADVVIAVGSDLDGMMTQNWLQPSPPTLITVNVDAAEASKAYAPTFSLVGDAASTLASLLTLLPTGRELTATSRDLEKRRAAARHAMIIDQPEAMRMLDHLGEILPADATVVADMCIPGYWYAALGRVGGPRRLAYPVGWGTLGFAFPASLGTAAAKALHGGGPVVCLCGDGGFLFAAGELATLAQERLPLTIVVVDDGGYGMLRYDQKHAGQQIFGVDLTTPDFGRLAESFGIRSHTVDGFGDSFAAALAEQVADPGPSMLVVRAHLDPPPTTSPRWYRRTR